MLILAMTNLQANFKRFHPDAKMPTKGSKGAAAYDIYSLEEVVIAPGETKLCRTGFGIELPAGYFLMIAPRSSLAIKKHLDMPNSVGIGDEDFVGEYMVAYRNIGNEEVIIEKGERFAQILFLKCDSVEFSEVDELKTTERGDGKFGSTGKL